jgi:hemerythrin-like domain-containing protein
MTQQEKKTIPEIMKRHHYQLEGLLNRFKRTRNEADAYPKVFNKFKWELEKHFFTEEKAIFTFIYIEDAESNNMKEELLKEHNKILSKLNEVENQIKANDQVDFEGFFELLTKHRDYEDEVFYPLLEQNLDNKKKKEIIDRITNPF